MPHPLRLLVVVTAALALVLAACGGDDSDGSSSGGSTSLTPLADAFADQLALDAGGGWFNALSRTQVECFAATALDTIDDQRQTELRFTVDNIPLLFEADWTDAEIDDLTETYDSCVDDNSTGTEALIASLAPQLGRYNDCLVPEITQLLGESYWLEQFQARFTPPRIEELSDEAQQQAGEEALEPIFAACELPGFDNGPYVPDDPGGCPDDAPPAACRNDEPGAQAGDGPEPAPGETRQSVLECSRDPRVAEDFDLVEVGDAWLAVLESTCEEQGRGTLISVRLIKYPCPEGPRDLQLPATGAPITEAAVNEACTQ